MAKESDSEPKFEAPKHKSLGPLRAKAVKYEKMAANFLSANDRVHARICLAVAKGLKAIAGAPQGGLMKASVQLQTRYVPGHSDLSRDEVSWVMELIHDALDEVSETVRLNNMSYSKRTAELRRLERQLSA